MNPLLAVAGCGTPAYVYDRADLRRAYADLRRALPDPSRLHLSVKANPHLELLAELAAAGCRAEITSVGEIRASVAAGFDPAQILVTGPGKSPADVTAALEHGIRRFSVDSPTDLARVGDLAAAYGTTADCLLRVNADVPVPRMGLSMTGTPSAFGADASWVLREPAAFAAAGAARVTGLHLYMGTNIDEADTLAAQFETSVLLATRLRDALGIPFTEVDLGGGFGMPYARAGGRPCFDELRGRLEPVLDRELPGWRDGTPVVSFESGRYLMGGCGTLVATVLDVKVSKGRTFVVLDTGIHHLGGMSGLRRVPRIVPDLVVPAERDEWVDDCSVVGPLCTPLDAWCQGVRLPRLAPGDRVAVPNVGAYGLTASLLAFLGHRPAVEVVTDGDTVVSTSRLELTRAPIAPAATLSRSSR